MNLTGFYLKDFVKNNNRGLATFSYLGRWWVWWQTRRWRKSQRNCPEARWRKPPKGIQPCLTHPIKLSCLKTKQTREEGIQRLWTNQWTNHMNYFISEASKEENCTSWSSSAVDIMNVTVDIRTCKKILDMVVDIGVSRRVDDVEE